MVHNYPADGARRSTLHFFFRTETLCALFPAARAEYFQPGPEGVARAVQGHIECAYLDLEFAAYVLRWLSSADLRADLPPAAGGAAAAGRAAARFRARAAIPRNVNVKDAA